MSLAPEIKIAEQRLSVLELAKTLGNVSAACIQSGVSSTQFYEYKRRFQTHGIEGLMDLPRVAHSHPAATPPEVEQRILEISLAHPAWGCNRLEAALEANRIIRELAENGVVAQKVGRHGATAGHVDDSRH